MGRVRLYLQVPLTFLKVLIQISSNLSSQGSSLLESSVSFRSTRELFETIQSDSSPLPIYLIPSLITTKFKRVIVHVIEGVPVVCSCTYSVNSNVPLELQHSGTYCAMSHACAIPRPLVNLFHGRSAGQDIRRIDHS